MDDERAVEPPATTGQGHEADSIRITRHGKMRVWVKKALDFFNDSPDRPLVLYSAPADVSASTMPRLVSVAEIVKREYLKAQDASTGDVTGLHQYNQLLFEHRDKIPDGHGQDRADALLSALDGHSRVKQSFAPHMKITLSVAAMAERQGTHQAPMTRRMSRAAKARRRKRQRKQRETEDAA